MEIQEQWVVFSIPRVKRFGFIYLGGGGKRERNEKGIFCSEIISGAKYQDDRKTLLGKGQVCNKEIWV